MIKLYHKDYYFPSWLVKKLPKQETHNLTYSHHAQMVHVSRGGRVTQLPQMIDLTVATPIEIKVENFEPTEVLYRFPYDGTEDIVMVIILSRWFVKTFWFNHRKDYHRTLDGSRYEVRKI